ncbi:sulfur globule family protein [Solemya velum gill symbiont]|uniref:sulfur globule family protein n=2 Tax=Solemya velum gill symbiont TaxID=2340 RepID=UPI00099825FB|nr:sulfur globule family protein [Solemya velum gill symbiont]OOY61705.1 hypothetical protein BOW04_08550 [Solemya velum gill symbiont]
MKKIITAAAIAAIMGSSADTNNSYYGRGYNNWDNRYNSRNGYGYAPYGYAPYGYAPVAAPVAPVAPQAPIAPEAAK